MRLVRRLRLSLASQILLFQLAIVLGALVLGAAASYLNESRQLFAAKYLAYLPCEEELQRELQRERRLLEQSTTVAVKPKGSADDASPSRQ